MKLAVSLKASGSGLLGIIGFCLIHGSFVGPACAQSTAAFHPDSSYTAESLLRNAARHVADKQWPEAIDLYLRVIEQHGDSVALAPAADEAGRTSLLYVNARLFCQKALASLPPEGLAQYRQRVDARAAALFRDAAERSDRAALRRVVCEFFASRSGDQAAELLGDLEFRAGRFREALAAYYTLLPNLNAQAGLVYPDSEIDPAQVAAKILLSRAARGDVPTEA